MKKITTCFLTWLGLYPTLIIVSFLLKDVLKDIPNYFRVLVLTTIVIPLMVYLIMPFFNKIYKRLFGEQYYKKQ